MAMFEMSAETAAEFGQKLREEAEAKLTEPVEAVAAFRRGGASTRMAISKSGIGALAYGASALFSKKQAGGLPDKVMLALTPTRLHAFKLKIRGANYSAGDEVGSWERTGLTAGTEQKMGVTMLSLESADGFKAALAPIGVRDDPIGTAFIASLGEAP
jgi:hypothetical protein